MKTALTVIVGALVLAACTDTADTFPLNDAAKVLGPVHVSFVRTGIGEGPVKITMADGEVLRGTYRVALRVCQFCFESDLGFRDAGLR